MHRGGASYTADTLRHIRAELGPDCPLVMVVGTDAFSSFDRWREWQEIPGLAHIVVARRPGVELPVGSEAARLVKERHANSVSELRSRPSGLVLELAPPLLEISATCIRQRIAAGRSPRYLTPDEVCRSIRAWGLYGAGPVLRANRSYSPASLMLQLRLNIIDRVAIPASTRTTG